jgi:hypothetical protein
MAARVALTQSKSTGEELQIALDDIASEVSVVSEVVEDAACKPDTCQTINVEELELAAVDVEDIEADGVKLSNEDDSLEVSDEDV